MLNLIDTSSKNKEYINVFPCLSWSFVRMKVVQMHVLIILLDEED